MTTRSATTNSVVLDPAARPSGGEGLGDLDGVCASGQRTDAKLTGAYIGILLFCIAYFGRPEDWIPGMAVIPVAKITGVLAIGTFCLSLLGSHKLDLPKEMYLLLLLFFQLCLAIPFSIWKGGSFDLVILNFGKVVLITLVLVQAVNTYPRLRRLIFIHTVAVVAVSGVSLFANVRLRELGRITGALGGIFGNPNDLAASISLVFPFAVAFLVSTRNPLKKTVWLASAAVLGFAVVATFSRGGFLSMLVTTICCFLFFPTKGNRVLLLFLVVGPLVAATASYQGNYVQRIASIVNPALDQTGSYSARNDLLLRALETTARHPLLGIGPGQFVQVSGNWHVTHNSYAELSAEAGIPAALFFIWMLARSFRRVLKIRKDTDTPSEVRLFGGALAASMAGFFVTLFFASVEYHFFPYFLVGYAVVLARIAGANSQSLARHNSRNGRSQDAPEPQPCAE